MNTRAKSKGTRGSQAHREPDRGQAREKGAVRGRAKFNGRNGDEGEVKRVDTENGNTKEEMW